MVYGCKHSRSVCHIYTHTSAQWSPANVGLTQARPNYHTARKFDGGIKFAVEVETAKFKPANIIFARNV